MILNYVCAEFITCTLAFIILSPTCTHTSVMRYIIWYTVPVASPTNLTAVQEGLTSIRVSWSPPTPLGDTTGYRIYYSDSGSSDSVDVSGGSTDNYTLTGLMMGATYTISIEATNIPSGRVETMITLCKFQRLNESIIFFTVVDTIYNYDYVATGMTFSLNGNSIPTDGSGRVRVTAINDNDEDALICRSGKAISSIGNWYLHPTEMSTDDGDRIVSGVNGVPDPRGWRRNRAIDSERHRLVRLRRATDTAEEGVFTCHIPGDFGTPVSVGIYYPSKSYMYTQSPVRVTCTQAISNQSLYTLPHSGSIPQ